MVYRKSIFFLIIVLWFLSCEERIMVVDYSIKDCKSDYSLDTLMRINNQIREIEFSKDLLSIEVLFVESCGFIVNPEVDFTEKTLTIVMDKNIDKEERLYALCLCCYSVSLDIAGIPEKKINEIEYRLLLSEKYSEKIEITQSLLKK